MKCPIEHTREARAAPRWVNVLKTALQILVFWSFFLVLIPSMIVMLEARLGIQSFATDVTRMAGVALFVILGSIGIYCGMTFALLGSGTPLPLDTTTKLVIVGPYRVVRNPMAMTGTFQGLAVGLFLGSPLTILYSMAGMLAWNLFARRWEEADLLARFGEPYERYRTVVPCWRPVWPPYERSVPQKQSDEPLQING